MQQIRIERLLTDAESIPLLERRLKLLAQGAVNGACKVRRVLIDGLKIVVLLDRIHLAFGDNSIAENLVVVPRWENLILSDIFELVIVDSQFLHVQVRLFVVPLHLNHRLLGLLLAPASLQDAKNAANYRALLGLSEQCELPDCVYHTQEDELAIGCCSSRFTRFHINLTHRVLLGKLLLRLYCG